MKPTALETTLPAYPEISIVYNFSPETADTRDNPGTNAEVEIESIKIGDFDLLDFLDSYSADSVLDAIRDHLLDLGDTELDARADYLRDAARDDRLESESTSS